MSSHNKIAVLGLDNSGKTTLIRRLLNLDEVNKIPPRTHGIDVTEASLTHKDNEFSVLFIDVGGLKVFQLTLWENLIESDIVGLIYVVDMTATDRIHNDLDAFSIIINKTNKVPILVLGNKVDILEHEELPMNTSRLFEILDIVEHKINDPFREIIVLPVSVKTGLNLDLIFDWLYRKVTKYDRK